MKKKGKKAIKAKSVFSKPKSFFAKKEKNSHTCDPLVCHNIDPSNYCFYQTSQTIKIYVTIPGVENLSKSKIKIRFHEKSFELSVYDLINSNYHLIFDNLSYCIIPNKCKYFIRKDKVILELTKEMHKTWKSLEEIVSKEEWIQAYCEYLEDIPEFVDADALYGFAEGMWEQLIKLQDNDFNYLKPPLRMHELIPSLRKQPSFKSLEAATNFYKSQLKKDCFNEPLYIILGGSLLEKQRLEKLAKLSSKNPENIDESTFKSNKSFTERNNSDKKEGDEMEKLAENKKSEGNAYYKTGKFYAALQMYLEAIELWPENAFFFSNASASYMMLGLYSEALSMAQKSVKVDSSFSKGYLRIGKCNSALGNTKAALKALNKTKELEGENSEEVEVEISRVNKLQEYLKDGKTAASCKNYALAASLYDSACSIATASSSLLLLRAEYLVLCDKIVKAKGIARNLLEQNVEDADAHCILGMVAYYQDEKEEAFKQFEEAFKISKNHAKTKALMETARELYDTKEKGNEAAKQKKCREALKLYSAGLQIDPKNKVVMAKLHYNIASVRIQLDEMDEAIHSLTTAIEIKRNYVRAYLKRATLYQEKNEHWKAIQDLKEAVRISPTEANKTLLSEARNLHKNRTRKNYYQTLNVPPSANPEEIKNAYKKLALLHHPDKHEGKKDKQIHERLFKDVSEAYSVLKDPRKRHKYDTTDDYDDFEDDLDENDLFKLLLLTQFLNRHPHLSNFFTEDEYYNQLDDDDDDSDYDDYDDYDDSYYSTESEESFA